MLARSWACPGICATTAATIHTMPSPTAALSSAPNAPSSTPMPGISSVVRRKRQPSPSSPLARIAPASSAPTRPKAGA